MPGYVEWRRWRDLLKLGYEMKIETQKKGEKQVSLSREKGVHCLKFINMRNQKDEEG